MLTIFWKFLRGAFSAVSKPNFAIRLKALDEIYKNYTYAHTFAPLRIQKFS